MALNIDTQDLVNYPGTTKRITADLESIVPVGKSGSSFCAINLMFNL